MKFTKVTLDKKVDNYYPKYKAAVEQGKRPLFFDRILHPKIIAGCEIRHSFEKKVHEATDAAAKSDMECRELRHGRKNYESFFNTINDFLFVLDEKGGIIHVNDTVVNRLGYSKEELAGKSVLLVHPEERREEAGRIVGEMLAGTSEFCPVPICTKSGEQIAVETRIKLGEWNGKTAIFGITTDISKLKLSEEKFAKAFQSNTVLMAISNIKDNRFVEANNLFLDTLGYARGEIIGKTTADLNLFVNFETRNLILEKFKRNERINDIEVEVRAKDGSHRWGLFSIDIIHIGKDHCLLTSMIDITERKTIEQQFKASEEKFRLMVDNTHDIIYTLTSDGTFTYVSPAWTALLGHPVDQVIGQNFQQFIHPDDIPTCIKFLNEIVETGEKVTGIEYRVKHADNTWYWHTSSAVPIKDETGNVSGYYGIAKDITKNKSMEIELNRNLNNMNMIINNSRDAINLVAIDGSFNIISPAFEKITGYTNTDIANRHQLQFAHQDDIEKVIKFQKEVLENGNGSLDYRLVKKDGTIAYIEAYGSMVKHDGKPIAYLVMSRDATIRTHLQDALKINDEKYRNLVTHSKDPIFSFDENRAYLYVNESFAKPLGKKPEDIIGKTPFEIFPKEEAEKRLVAVNKVFQTGAPVEIEVKILLKNGDAQYYSTLADPIKDSTGKVVSVSCISRNITERKLAEDELKVSTARWEFALENSKQGVWDFNINNDEIFFSPQWKRMLGYEEHEISNKKSEYESRVHPDDLPRVLAAIGDNIAGKTNSSNVEHRLKTKEGKYIWVAGIGKIVERTQDGKPLRMIGTMANISERKEYEEKLLKQAQELSERNAEKDKFFNIIAHDLKSPMSGIKGASRTLAEELDSMAPAEIKDFALTLKDATAKYYSFLENLLEWSRSSSGKMKCEMRITGLYLAVEKKRQALLLTAAKKNITIINNVPHDFEAWADEKMLGQIIQNLLSNSIKFTHQGGCVEIYATEESGQVKVTVKDNGTGMPHEALDMIFKLDSKYTTFGTENEEGTGLGLTIVKSMVKNMGSNIWAESELDVGSMFHFTLKSASDNEDAKNSENLSG